MKLNSKLTWGLAWTGLAVVLAVPSADFLTGQFGAKGSNSALITSTADPVNRAPGAAPLKTATVTTKVTKTGVTIIPAGANAPALDPVNELLKAGKKLPDYISDTDSTDDAATVPTDTPAESTQVATIEPDVAPTPFPQRPPDVTRPAPPRAAQPTVIVDEDALASPDDAPPDQLAVNDGPVPPAGIQNDWQNAKDRKLTRFLEKNGLIEGASADGRSSASVTIVERPAPAYDPDGFYLSDGPNNSRAARRARIQRMLDAEGDANWF